jgi:hypothetical protein
MPSNHRHDTPPRATAAPPTLSLLRLSAAERALGAGVLLALLWLLVFWVLN